MNKKKRYLMRIIIPAFPSFNIYSFTARKTTSVGPIYVATAASKLDSWDVEVIDENNCRSRFCPKNGEGLPDHVMLQKERPADVAGFYGSITTSIPRLYKLAELYKHMGAKTVAGGKHVEYMPREALQNHVDVVVLGEGERTIQELLPAWENDQPLGHIAGIVFLKENQLITTALRPLITDFDFLPFPDFNLLRYAKIKRYPINRIRGCNMNCEFCVVKDKTRSANPEWMMKQVAHLVETRNAHSFFEASDHFAANKAEAIEFCRLLADYQKRVGRRLKFAVQTRITDARDPELLQAMKEAGIDVVCIGYESPIDEELRAMRKGYLSKEMIQLTQAFHRFGFLVHGMFIFGYPRKMGHQNDIPMPFKEKIRRFHTFIKKAKIDTVQVLHAIPIPGTDLRRRLQDEGKLYPLEYIGWEYYDGQFPLFEPDDGVSPEELQEAIVKKIMSRFYRFQTIFKIAKNILLHFPRIVFLSAATIITFRVKYIKQAFATWKKRYFRNEMLRFGGHIIAKRWFRKFRSGDFSRNLISAKEHKRKVKES